MNPNNLDIPLAISKFLVIIRSTLIQVRKRLLENREKMIVFMQSQIPAKQAGLSSLTGDCVRRHGYKSQQRPVTDLAVTGTNYHIEFNLLGIGMR